MPIKKLIKTKEKLAGIVTHYFSNIKVAVINFKDPVKIGDVVRIEGGKNTNFEQKITSMQEDHQEIVKAKKGQEVGLKVKEKVHEGYKVFKV